MKIRQGFVTNSSSSSFVCCMCDAQEEGWDASPSDFGWTTCEHGHIICEKCMPAGETEETEDRELLSKYCPICTFKEYDRREMAGYLLKKVACCTREEVFAEVKKLNKRRKKLYDEEYISAVCSKTNKSDEDYLKEIREGFETWENFIKYVRGY